jgi:methylenetetrahydrofolate reductase (NADPH)
MFHTRLEIMPSEGIVEKIQAAVPLTTTLTLTCLPHHGIGRTMRAAVQLSLLGYTVVPHLTARSLEDRSQLAGIIRDCGAAGISEVFAVGGDASRPAGPYANGGELLREIAEISGGQLAVGIAGYPEGHPGVGHLQLLESLLAKQELASSAVTQMCFSADRIHSYVAMLRREGVTLPVLAGVAGAVQRTRLIALATKIGVGTSLRFVSRTGPLARRLLSGERYSPGSLIDELTAQHVTDGIHLYSFNCFAPLPA